MNEKTSVYLDVLPWDLRSRNTDWRYVRYGLPRLKDYEPGLALTLQTSRGVTLLGNLKAARMAIGWRVGLPLGVYDRETSYLASGELAQSRCNVIFSQRGFPLNAGEVPIVWENAIVDPEMQRSWWAKPSDLDEEYEAKEKLFRRAAVVQVFSDAEARRHAATFPDLASRFVGIPWFAPHIQACDRVALEKHRDPPTVRILFVGNNAIRKGIDQLLDAFVQLPARVQRRALLTVISNFDRSHVDIPSNERIVVIRGAPSLQVMAEMRRAHIFVNVARFETYGVVFHEAMSQGVACLAPNWEVQRELFDNGRAGMNLPCETSAVKNALEKLIEDEEFRYAMGVAAWNRYQQKYAPPLVARRYAQMFHKAVNGGVALLDSVETRCV